MFYTPQKYIIIINVQYKYIQFYANLNVYFPQGLVKTLPSQNRQHDMHNKYSTPQTIYLPETKSTNQALQILADAENIADKSIVWTGFQTKGRGQVGNSWESAPRMNLLCSILLYPPYLQINQSFFVLELAALSVKYTLEKYVSDISIKWPNDIYFQNKKISGILIENDMAENMITRSIIGIGINLNQTVFESEAPNPVSLSMITGDIYNIKAVLSQLHANFSLLASELVDGAFDRLHLKYCNSLYHRDGFYGYKDAKEYFEARIHTVEPSGYIILERRDGILSRYGFKQINYE